MPIAAVPGQQVCFEASVIADKRQRCARSRACDVGGKQAAAVRALIAVGCIAVRTEPVDAVADAGGGFDIHLARRAAGNICQSERAGVVKAGNRVVGRCAAVQAQHLRFVIGNKHRGSVYGNSG